MSENNIVTEFDLSEAETMRAKSLAWWRGLSEQEKVDVLNKYKPYKFFDGEYTVGISYVIGSCKIEWMYRKVQS